MRFKFLFLAVAFILTPVMALAQTQVPPKTENIQVPLEKENILVEVKDLQGERVQGYLELAPKELTVTTKDKEEKSVPLKMIESIKLEKIHSGLPGAEQRELDSYYSVRLQNSQEIFTLSKKYTFSLNTSIGVLTKTLDPEAVQPSGQKEASLAARSKNDQPFIRDKSVVLSLEIKF